jgi:hypothetical protein
MEPVSSESLCRRSCDPAKLNRDCCGSDGDEWMELLECIEPLSSESLFARSCDPAKLNESFLGMLVSDPDRDWNEPVESESLLA